MTHSIAVSELDKDSIKQLVMNQPGVYEWWFDEDGTSFLLRHFVNQINYSKIRSKIINGKKYYCLYFGISNNLRGRIRWHLLQNHSSKSVEYGTLSTLRQTISSLLEINMTQSQKSVTDFLQQHCYWEWDYLSDPHKKELEELNSPDYYYPLNIQENRTLPKDILQQIKNLRKTYKK